MVDMVTETSIILNLWRLQALGEKPYRLYITIGYFPLTFQVPPPLPPSSHSDITYTTYIEGSLRSHYHKYRGSLNYFPWVVRNGSDPAWHRAYIGKAAIMVYYNVIYDLHLANLTFTVELFLVLITWLRTKLMKEKEIFVTFLTSLCWIL